MSVYINKYKLFEASAEPAEVELPETGTGNDTTNSSKVILYNDEWHTFEEVIGQIIKAIKCTPEKAESLTLEVHYKGKAVVYEGDMPECLKVSSILEEIDLHTQIEY
jgi:ATP-dependent Clp protease adaptor protein ClpS